jgi:hypothetical protein
MKKNISSGFKTILLKKNRTNPHALVLSHHSCIVTSTASELCPALRSSASSHTEAPPACRPTRRPVLRLARLPTHRAPPRALPRNSRRRTLRAANRLACRQLQ